MSHSLSLAPVNICACCSDDDQDRVQWVQAMYRATGQSHKPVPPTQVHKLNPGKPGQLDAPVSQFCKLPMYRARRLCQVIFLKVSLYVIDVSRVSFCCVVWKLCWLYALVMSCYAMFTLCYIVCRRYLHAVWVVCYVVSWFHCVFYPVSSCFRGNQTRLASSVNLHV